MKLFSKNAIKCSGAGSNCTIDGTQVGIVVVRTQMTIRVRFKVISSTFGYDIIKKDGEYKLSIDTNGNIVFSVYDGLDWDPAVIGPIANVGEWYDVVCVISVGSNVINKVMYVNTITNKFTEITQGGDITQTTNSLIIGDSEVVVDNFMVWSKALPETDIDVLFKGGIVFSMLDFWLAFEDIDMYSTDTTEIIYKRYKGILNNFEIVDGKELENIKALNNKIVVVKKY